MGIRGFVGGGEGADIYDGGDERRGLEERGEGGFVFEASVVAAYYYLQR